MSAAAMLAAAQWVLFAAGIACDVLAFLGRLERGFEYGCAMWAVTDACAAVGYALQGRWGAAGLFAFFTACCASCWWDRHKRNRRKRRVLAMLGAKSRALRDAIVGRMRELRPRPVLRPVPVPA